MKAVIQRVKKAAVSSGEYNAETGKGLLVLVAVNKNDNDRDIEYMVDKTINLRIFSDDEGKLNLSVKDIGGEIMAVSQFTLYGDCSKGRRPSFDKSAERGKGKEYFDKYVDGISAHGLKVKTGLFGEDMAVELVNTGPVTIIVES